MFKSVLKPFLPMVEKALQSRQLDESIQLYKEKFNNVLRENETVELLITTESFEGQDVEYVSAIALNGNSIRILKQIKLTELLTILLNEL